MSWVIYTNAGQQTGRILGEREGEPNTEILTLSHAGGGWALEGCYPGTIAPDGARARPIALAC